MTLLRGLRVGFQDLNEVTPPRHRYLVLEDDVVTRVKSRSLKRFYVPHKRTFSSSRVTPEYILEIDALGLEYMSLKEDHFHIIVVKNLNSLFTIDLDMTFFVGVALVLIHRNHQRDMKSSVIFSSGYQKSSRLLEFFLSLIGKSYSNIIIGSVQFFF